MRNVKGEFVYFHIDEWHSSLKMTARRQIFDIKLKKQVFDGIQTRTVASARDDRTNMSIALLVKINFTKRGQYPTFLNRKEVFWIHCM